MKKGFIFLILLCFGLTAYAQQLDPNSQIKVSDRWTSELKNGKLILYNGKITNNGDKPTRKLRLDYYLSPTPFDASEGKLSGVLIAQTPITPIKRRASILNVSIQAPIDETDFSGEYYPILVLYDSSGDIKDIVQLQDKIVLRQGREIEIEHLDMDTQQKAKKETGKTAAIQITEQQVTIKGKDVVTEKVTARDGDTEVVRETFSQDSGMPVMTRDYISPVATMEVVADNAVTLDNDWKVEVDFKNFSTKISGGNISNRSSFDYDNLVLDVYLTPAKMEDIDTSFTGLRIASADIQEIKSHQVFIDTTVTSNLTIIPDPGTYYILMTLSTVDDDGNVMVRNTRTFENPVSF